MQRERRPLVLRRRSVLAAIGGIGLASIAGVYSVRGQAQGTPVPTIGGEIPGTSTGGEGTAAASSVPSGTLVPPAVTMTGGISGNGVALSTTAAQITPITTGSGTNLTAAPMGPTPTHITGIGPLPQPLPTQGGVQPTFVGAAPPTPAMMSGTPSASPTPAPSARVTITPDGKFDPPIVTINRGASIQWMNMNRAPQTVTDDPNSAADKNNAVLPMGAQSWDSGVLNTGSPYMKVFDVPGDYTYFSIPGEGQGLVGRITVMG